MHARSVNKQHNSNILTHYYLFGIVHGVELHLLEALAVHGIPHIQHMKHKLQQGTLIRSKKCEIVNDADSSNINKARSVHLDIKLTPSTQPHKKQKRTDNTCYYSEANLLEEGLLVAEAFPDPSTGVQLRDEAQQTL